MSKEYSDAELSSYHAAGDAIGNLISMSYLQRVYMRSQWSTHTGDVTPPGMDNLTSEQVDNLLCHWEIGNETFINLGKKHSLTIKMAILIAQIILLILGSLLLWESVFYVSILLALIALGLIVSNVVSFVSDKSSGKDDFQDNRSEALSVSSRESENPESSGQ